MRCAAGRQVAGGSRPEKQQKAVGFYGLDVYSLSASTQVRHCRVSQADLRCMQACLNVHCSTLVQGTALCFAWHSKTFGCDNTCSLN